MASGDTVAGRFARQVAATPDAVAVCAGGATLTYRQLDERAGVLARHLIDLGVRPDSVVGVLHRRSPQLVVSLLAVARTGAAYLPLHERHPAARHAAVLADSGARILLVDRRSTGSAPDVPGIRPVPAEDASRSEAGPAPAVAGYPDGAAYVMYTSGSSGEPKGVVVTHGSVVGLVDDPCWDEADHSRVLLHAPHAFDVSTYELWVPLLRGGTVVIAPDGDLELRRLSELIARHRVTAAHFTAGLFAVVAEECPQALRPLSEVLTGGDVVSPDAVARVLEVCPNTSVRQLYGPTEATLFVAHRRFEAPYSPAAPLPIGRARRGATVRLLDAGRREVDTGEPGEVYLAGAPLARGYLHRPGATAERFLPDPSGPPGTRMYRPGDLARRRPDGDLEFIGRLDEQVKIRGHRVEPGEVEAVLAGHPDVGPVVVGVRADERGDKRLIAFVAPAPGRRVDAAQVLRHAARVLPDYAVPEVTVRSALPLTVNGKIDRVTLLAELPPPDPIRDPSAPSTDRRVAQLAGLFADVLGRSEVGADDDFFALGGHSLLATRLVDRVEARFGVELPLGTVLSARTPARLAQCLRAPASGRGGALLTLRGTAGRRPLFCVHPAAGSSSVYAPLVGFLPSDVPVYGLQAPGLDDRRAEPESLAALAEQYVEQIRTVQPRGPYQLLGWSFGGVVAHFMASRLHDGGEAVDLLAHLDAYPTSRPDGTPLRLLGADEARAEILRSLGILVPSRVVGVDVDTAAALLASTSGPPAGHSPGYIESLVKAFTRHTALLNTTAVPRFPGDLLFFRAARSAGPVAAVTSIWRPFVAGRLTVRDIDCAHGELMQTANARSIALVLTGRLDTSGG